MAATVSSNRVSREEQPNGRVHGQASWHQIALRHRHLNPWTDCDSTLLSADVAHKQMQAATHG